MEEYALECNSLSFPLTLLEAWTFTKTHQLSEAEKQKFDWNQITQLRFDLVGVPPGIFEEAIYLIRYEEILHVYPSLQKLEIMFIVTEEAIPFRTIEACLDNCCEECKAKKRKLVFNYSAHKSYPDPSSPLPECIFALNLPPEYFGNAKTYFNFIGPDFVSCIERILRLRVPLCITSKRERELQIVSNWLLQQNCDMMLPPTKNELRGYGPFVDPELDDPLTCFNSHYLVAKGK